MWADRDHPGAFEDLRAATVLRPPPSLHPVYLLRLETAWVHDRGSLLRDGGSLPLNHQEKNDQRYNMTFVLTTGGHNAGIVSEPGHPRRGYQIATRKEGEIYIDPDQWQAMMPRHEGSWWPAWQSWLESHSTGLVDPPSLGLPKQGYPPLGDSPGLYVLQP